MPAVVGGNPEKSENKVAPGGRKRLIPIAQVGVLPAQRQKDIG